SDHSHHPQPIRGAARRREHLIGTAMTTTKEASNEDGATAHRSHYEQALDMLLTHRGDAAAMVDRALADDPADVAAHCLRAPIIVCGDAHAAGDELAASITAIEQARPVPREPAHRHAAAAQAWLAGDPTLALERYGAIVLDQPRDIVALAVAHAL